MSDKNPTRPDDSPIRTEHAGAWDPTVYRNYVQSPAKPQGGLKAHVYGRPGQSTTEVFASAYDYEYSKTDDAKVDKALEQAINRDLSQRNIPKAKSKTNRTKNKTDLNK